MAKKRDDQAIPQDKLALYEKLVGTNPDLERKGATMPYTSFNGNMFSFLTKDGSLALRLPKQAREDFLAKYKTRLVEANGTIMKEYVAVPDALLQDTDELKPYFDLSFQYVQNLKPKPQKKGKGTN
jgi:TfoX/Sxy family transcriptional regulator of competence genes